MTHPMRRDPVNFDAISRGELSAARALQIGLDDLRREVDTAVDYRDSATASGARHVIPERALLTAALRRLERADDDVELMCFGNGVRLF